MAVRVELIDDPGGKFLVKISSDLDEEEVLLVATNGAVVLRNESYGEDVDLWAGFAQEPEPFEFDDDKEESS